MGVQLRTILKTPTSASEAPDSPSSPNKAGHGGGPTGAGLLRFGSRVQGFGFKFKLEEVGFLECLCEF